MRFGTTTLILATLLLGACAGCKVIEDSDSAQGSATSSVEQSVDINQLPINVAAAVKGAMPSGTITSAQQVTTRRGKMVYQLVVRDGEKNYDMLIAPDGTVLSTQQRK
jgi:hypothetical protein